jgi:hypothetical protein
MSSCCGSIKATIQTKAIIITKRLGLPLPPSGLSEKEIVKFLTNKVVIMFW